MKSSAAESKEGQPGFVRFCMRCPGGVGGEARKFSEWCVCVCVGGSSLASENIQTPL